ncbi:MAG: metal-dependent hydrolase [Thermoplasmata archaeon]|nr:metal-dependent hydrolase [Thermoplasmata archaeon]MCI4359652.1 metal-dependent hydrolase [Thermoplasmata archaeon]
MDLFTHVLIAYLVSYGVWGPGGLQYIAAGALAGGLPDSDALFFPLAKRFPLLRHHGITHSIFGVTVIAAVGAFVVPSVFAHVIGPSFAAGSTLYYFLAMEGGGLSHVFLDGFTHYSVPPFAPFSKLEFHLDADRAINLGTFAFTGFSFWLLLYERGRVPVALWELTTWLLLAIYLSYLAVRGVGRWKAGTIQKKEGYSSVIPTGNPFVFLLAEERAGSDSTFLRFTRLHLLRGREDDPRSIRLHPPPNSPGPVASPQEALERSYHPSISKGWMLSETHHFAEVREAPDHFTVFWYSLEFSMLGRSAGVVARVDSADGHVDTRSAWMAPKNLTA